MQSDLFTPTIQTISLADADVCYYPGFVANQQNYFSRLKSELAWRQDKIQMYGKPVLIPRLNVWYGDSDAHYSYSGLNLMPLNWTPTLLELKQRVESFLDCKFNSVLANFYRDGNDSVSWHSDDEPELGDDPLIASLSFGGSRRFSLRHRYNKSQTSSHINLDGGSLLVMQGSTQRYWHHQVAKTAKPVAGRINLTFRTIRTDGTGRRG